MATVSELRAAVVDSFLSQVGYTSGSYESSKYGLAQNWRSPWLGGVKAWQGLYCGRSYSWNFDQVLGAEAGRAAIGLQGYAIPVGFAATWLHREWFMANNRHVGFANSQPGDAFLFKLPGRPLNPTNHIGMFVKWHTPGKVAITVEGNLPNPTIGTTSSIGVHLHYRDITYVVGVYRPNWQAAATIYNKQNPDPKEGITVAEADRIIERIDTLRRERTNAHVKELANQEAILARLEAVEAAQAEHTRQNNTIGRVAAEARELARSTPQRIIDARVPFSKGTSLHRLFGKDFRFGALLGYGAASMVDRDTHTEEIVDALDHDAIEAEIHANTQED